MINFLDAMSRLITILFFLFFRVGYCYAQRAMPLDKLKDYMPLGSEVATSVFSYTSKYADILSINSYYIKSAYLCGEKCDSTFFYIKFNVNGTVFWSFPYLTLPKGVELSDTTYGKYGTYSIISNKIRIKIYQDKHSKELYFFAKPVSSGIQFYKTTALSAGQLFPVNKSKAGGYYKRYNL